MAQDGLPKTILEIGQGSAPFFIIALTGSLLIVEGAAMLAERYLKERYNKGREEERRAWIEWNQRREQAIKDGQDFTEPPPPPSKPE